MSFATVHFSPRGSGARRIKRGHVETLGETLDDLGTIDRASMVVLRLSGPSANWGHLILLHEETVPDPSDPGSTKTVTVAHRRYRVDLTTLLNRVNGTVRNRITRRMAKIAERNDFLNNRRAGTEVGPNENDRRRQGRRNFGPGKLSHVALLADITASLTTLDAIEQSIDDDYPTGQVAIPLIDDTTEIIDDYA